MRCQTASAGMGVTLAVETNDAPFVFEFCDGVHDGRSFAKAEECRDIGKFDRPGGVERFPRFAFRCGRKRRRRRGLLVCLPRRPRPRRRRIGGEDRAARSAFFFCRASWVSFQDLTRSGQSGSDLPRGMMANYMAIPLGIKSQSGIFASVEIQLTPDAKRQALRLPTRIRIRVHDLIQRLESWPNVSGIKPLRHDLKGAFRIRTGDYRVLFTVSGDTIVVFRIDHRRDVYH